MKKNLAIGIAVGLLLLIMAGAVVSMRMEGMTSAEPMPNPLAKLTVGGGRDGALPVLAESMPEFSGITSWLNSDTLTTADLKGKVVLIDFWTYSCINCLRTLPYVTSWYGKYEDTDFVVIGVHTPEFAFEKEEKNVRAAIKRLGIGYPVALDNAYGTWNAYGNQYWPAHYLFDGQGRLRHYHFGEGAYDETEAAIQALLKEAGHPADMPMTEGTSQDLTKIGSPETYLGYERSSGLASPEPVKEDASASYSFPKKLDLNTFAFSGAWTVEAERAVPSKGAKLEYRYSSSNANLVLSNLHDDGPALRIEVTLDGKPVPENSRGADLNVDEDEKTYLLVKDQRLYEITNTGNVYGEHFLELRFDEPGTAAYAFTFG